MIEQNSLVLKIHNGTVRGDGNLCATCRNCQRMQGAHSGRDYVTCHANYQWPITLREPMASCSAYSDARRPTLQMMADIAWSLMTDKGGKRIGFLSPEELRKRSGTETPAPPTIGF